MLLPAWGRRLCSPRTDESFGPCRGRPPAYGVRQPDRHAAAKRRRAHSRAAWRHLDRRRNDVAADLPEFEGSTGGIRWL